MMPLKRLLVVSLVVLSLSLSVPSLSANGSEPQGVRKGSPPSPPARIEDQNETTQKHQKSHGAEPAENNKPLTIEGTVSKKKIDLYAAEIEARAQNDSKPWWQRIEWWTLILAAAASVAAALAYFATKRQADTADKAYALAITPRLHIDGVRIVNFVEGRSPVFFVKIVNSGPAPARDVEFLIRVETTTPEYEGAKYTGGPHSFTIPENSYREEFIWIGQQLTGPLIDGLHVRRWELRVSGHYKYAEQTHTYCYRYNPVIDPMMDIGLPQFIACDANIQRTIIKVIGTAVESDGPASASGKTPTE